jgi:hypothetical protein
MGNVIAPVLAHEVGNIKTYLAKTDLGGGANVIDLEGRFDLEPYLRPTSDIVGMMVLAHQATVHNLITRAGWEARKAAHDGEPMSGRVRGAAESLVRAMLFVKEAPFGAPLKGTSGFTEDFARRGVRDNQGRSLREFDLERRLFKYPLSFLVYSESFDALPPLVKDYVYTRLRQVLGGQETAPEFAHLTEADRTAILEILETTKPGFRAANTTAR